MISKTLKFFLISFVLSAGFCAGTNFLEKELKYIFFWKEFAGNSEVLFAQLAPVSPIRDLSLIGGANFNYSGPRKKQEIVEPQLKARSALSVWIPSENFSRTKGRILFQKSGAKKLPIASLTKLMSALIVLENYDISQKIAISETAVKEEGSGAGVFKLGEVFTALDLVRASLIESNNVAIRALADFIGEDAFVQLMNLKAEKLELGKTYFVNSTGLGPQKIGDPLNYSTAEDLITLSRYILAERKIIWEILSVPETDLYLPGTDILHHKVLNTNELLTKTENSWQRRIIGGKTGWTPESNGCLLLVLEAPKKQGYLMSVVLSSDERFVDMENLLDWIRDSYRW